MEKKNVVIMVILLFIAGVLVGVGGYNVVENLRDKKEDNQVKETNQNDTEQTKEENEMSAIPYEELENIIDSSKVSGLLMNYLKSGQTNFSSYINNIDNDYKLYLADIGENKTFAELESNLTNLFGSSIGVKPEDFHYENIPDTVYIYDNASKRYKDSENEIGTDYIGFTDTGLYNYKLKDISVLDNGISIIYYGLYIDYADLGPDLVTNNKNIERQLGLGGLECIGCDIRETDNSYIVDDELYFDDMFEKNKNDFFQFKYTFTKTDDGYILTGFEKVA